MESLHPNAADFNPEVSACLQSPPEALAERLMLGWAEIDDELLRKAYAAADYFEEFPAERARWMRRLRILMENPLTWRSWAAVLPILQGPVSPALSQSTPAQPQPEQRQQKPTPAPEPPDESEDKKALWHTYNGWRSSAINDEAYKEASEIAPALVNEAFEAEERAARARSADAARAFLANAGARWAAILNIEAPALGGTAHAG